jgi:hypothetical protein
MKSSWDGAAALARCIVPVLYISSQRLCSNVERLRMVCPRIVVETVRLRHVDQREAAVQVNAQIDAFLPRPHWT